jgi:hypothetical protein
MSRLALAALACGLVLGAHVPVAQAGPEHFAGWQRVDNGTDVHFPTDLQFAPTAANVIMPTTSDVIPEVVAYQRSTGKIWVGRMTSATTMDFAMNASPFATLPANRTNLQFALGDFLGDAKADLAFYDPDNGEIKVLQNLGSSFGTGPTFHPSPTTGWIMKSGRFDSDQSTAKSQLLLYYDATTQGTGNTFVSSSITSTSITFSYRTTLPPGGGWQLNVGDLTGDARDDVLAYRAGEVRVYASTGSGFAIQLWPNMDASGWRPSLGYFSNRGTADLAAYFYNDSVYEKRPIEIYRNTGDNTGGRFWDDSSTGTTLEPGYTRWTVIAADFVGAPNPAIVAPDGLDDLFVYFPDNGNLSINRNVGLRPEGFASPQSVAPGSPISFSWSGELAPGANVTLARYEANAQGQMVVKRCYRTLVESAFTNAHAPTTRKPILGGGEAWKNGPRWSANWTLTLPDNPVDFPSGFYALRLAGANATVGTTPPTAGTDCDISGDAFDITFVVKPKSGISSNHIAVIANTNTWNAYNGWGGKSKYEGAAYTTVLRPNPSAQLFPSDFPQKHLAKAELFVYSVLPDPNNLQDPIVAVDLFTDLDFHSGSIPYGTGPGQYTKLVLNTHPEYWTADEYDRLKAFLDVGGSVVYLGGNGIFERVAYSNVTITTQVFRNGVEGGPRKPVLFRVLDSSSGTPARAERALLGTASWRCGNAGDGTAYVVRDDKRSHPVFANVTFGSGGTLGQSGLYGGASGHETDRRAGDGIQAPTLSNGNVIDGIETSCDRSEVMSDIVEGDTTPAPGPGADPGVEILAEGQAPTKAHMTFYRVWRLNANNIRVPKGFVFSVGSIAFGQSLLGDTQLKQLVHNVLHMN